MMPMPDQIAKSSLYKFSQVQGKYVIEAPTIKGLVLSGGGARGIAYPGMQQAMVENDTFKHVTYIAGASAGAMTGSFMALGYCADDIEAFLTRLNFHNLLDSKGRNRVRARGYRFQNLLEMIYLVKMKQHFKLISEPEDNDLYVIYWQLEQKISCYNDIFENLGIELNSVEGIIALSEDVEKLEQVDLALRDFSKRDIDESGKFLPSHRFTFADFDNIRRLLPEDMQYQIKHLTVNSSNQTKNEEVLHNVSNCPGDSVAECAQRSGAHPLLFSPMKGAEGDYYADGAFHDNMPASVLEKLGLETHQILCVALLSDDELEFRQKVARGIAPHQYSAWAEKLDAFFKMLIGTEVHKYFADSYDREKLFYHFGNMLFLTTGDLSITDVKPTDERKELALNNGYEQTKALFDNRNQQFSSPILAMLFLGYNSLEQMCKSAFKKNTEQFNTASKAKRIFKYQNHVVRLLSSFFLKDGEIKRCLEEIQKIICSDELGLSEEEQQKALAVCYRQINFLSEGKLEAYCEDTINSDPSMQKEETGFFQNILNLLKQCLDWILSCLTLMIASKAPEVDVEVPCFEEEIWDEKSILSPTVGFFKPILDEIATEESRVHTLGYL